MEDKILRPDQPLYQSHVSGILDKRVISRPLIGQENGIFIYSCEGYQFLSIMTDGGLNPRNNLDASGSLGEYNGLCQIVFDDSETFFINQELRNIPLISKINPSTKNKVWKKSFRWFNILGEIPGANRGIESGFGNIYFILTQYPFKEHILHHNPFWCLQKNLEAETEDNYWFGINRVSSTYTMGIPYLPMIYERIAYMINSTALSFQVFGMEYWHCHNSPAYSVLNKTVNSYCQLDNHTDRFRMRIINNDGETRQFSIQLAWVNKSNETISY